MFKDGPKSARFGNEAEADGVANGTKWKPNEKISDLAKVTPMRIWTNWPRIWTKWVLEGQTGTRRAVRNIGPIHKESPTSLFGTLPYIYIYIYIETERDMDIVKRWKQDNCYDSALEFMCFDFCLVFKSKYLSKICPS